MKKRLQKLLSVTLVLSMLLSMLSVSSFAVDVEEQTLPGETVEEPLIGEPDSPDTEEGDKTLPEVELPTEDEEETEAPGEDSDETEDSGLEEPGEDEDEEGQEEPGEPEEEEPAPVIPEVVAPVFKPNAKEADFPSAQAETGYWRKAGDNEQYASLGELLESVWDFEAEVVLLSSMIDGKAEDISGAWGSGSMVEELTIDLNGKRLTLGSDYSSTRNVTLIIKDSEGGGVLDLNGYHIRMAEGSFIWEGGELNGERSGQLFSDVGNKAVVQIKSGSVVCNEGYPIFPSGLIAGGERVIEIYQGVSLVNGDDADEAYRVTECEHIWEKRKLITPATCTQAGQAQKICSKCGAEGELIELPAGHVYSGTPQVVAPTCTTEGYTIRICSRSNCPGVPKTDIVPALKHDWSDWSVISEVSCTEDGERERHCRRDGCNETETEVIPALQHDYVVERVEATCTEAGFRTERCRNCGEVHRETIPALDHSYTAQVIAPTCDAEGYTAHQCIRCGDSYEDTRVAATGHTPDTEYHSDETGHWHLCTVCGAELEKEDHTPVTDPAVPATTTSTGLTEGSHCSVCNYVLVEQQEIPRLPQPTSPGGGGSSGGGSGRPSGGGSGGGSGTNPPATTPSPAPSEPAETLPPEEDLGEEDVPLADLPIWFTDVKESDWYYTAVEYMTKSGLMEGMTADTFVPELEISRAMIVTVLYRLAGEPEVEITPMSDVDGEQWYAKAVSWAIANGILTGYENGLFLPDGKITREEMVTVMYRFGKTMGYELDANGDLSAFTDRDAVSGWAVESMRWAVGANLIVGRGRNLLAPAGTTTRGEAVTIFARFDQAYTGVGKEPAALPEQKPEETGETGSDDDGKED